MCAINKTKFVFFLSDNLSSDSPKTHPKQANILSVEDDATHENLSLQRQDSTSRKKDADEIVNETFPSDAINNEVIPTQLEQCSSSSTKNSTSLVPQSFLSDVINNEQIPTQLEKGSSNSSSSSSSLVPQTILNPSEFLGLSNVLTLKHQENSPWL